MRYKVETGRRYRATLELSGFEAMFATAELICGKFEEVGFEDVQVVSDDPWQVEGTWNGKPTSADVPEQIVNVELVVDEE